MDEKIIIIAEAGVNHNGSIETAKKLIDAAAEAGVDYVKFQSFVASEIASAHAPKASYQTANTNKVESQLEMLQKLELSEEDHYTLQAYCKSKNVQFLSSAFDFQSIDLLERLGIKLGKIPSGEITNLLYLRKMAKTFPRLIFSTGMANMEDIEATLKVLLHAGAKKDCITILHCNTEYPTPMEDVNLLAMNSISRKFEIAVGYSDHTLGIEVPIAAAALGAKVIEKHFTLDKTSIGPDHKASLEPTELKALVVAIRNIEKALGSNQKITSPSEEKNKNVARKSLVAKTRISKGEKFTIDNIIAKRPGNGISPMRIEEVFGKVALKDFDPDQLIEL